MTEYKNIELAPIEVVVTETPKFIEVNDLATARRLSPPKARTKRMFQLYAFCVIGFLCSSMNGYDGSVLGK
jgi:hypothetical protein